MLSTGDPLWRDYSVRLQFVPQTKQGRSGLALRMHNSRCYYFFGFDEKGLIVLMVQLETGFHQPLEETLGSYTCD